MRPSAHDIAMRYCFGDYELATERYELRLNSIVLHVEPLVFDLILFFCRHASRILSRDEIIAGVWQGRTVSEATIDGCIRFAGVQRIGLPNFYWTHLMDAAAKGQLGRLDAGKALSRILEIRPNFSACLELRKWNACLPDLDHIMEGLRKAGWDEKSR